MWVAFTWTSSPFKFTSEIKIQDGTGQVKWIEYLEKLIKFAWGTFVKQDDGKNQQNN